MHCNFPVGLWGTTLTENTSNNRELFVRTTLRELLVYLVFLVDICLCKYYYLYHPKFCICNMNVYSCGSLKNQVKTYVQYHVQTVFASNS